MPTQASLAAAFKAFDTDGSGTLSAEEMLQVLTRKGGGASLSIDDAKAVIATVDYNGDGVLDLEEFVALMSGDAEMAALLPAPSADAAERKAAFDAATKTVKPTSPVKALFERVAAHDPSLTELALNIASSDNALNMEWTVWPDSRKATALALLCGNPAITKVNLAGTKLNDAEAAALASALGADSKIEVLNLERNALREPGLLAIVGALAANATLRELRLTDQSTPITTPVEVAFAELLDGGGAPSLVKFSPSMRNPNEKRRVDAALSRNQEAARKRRQAAAAAEQRA